MASTVNRRSYAFPSLSAAPPGNATSHEHLVPTTRSLSSHAALPAKLYTQTPTQVAHAAPDSGRVRRDHGDLELGLGREPHTGGGGGIWAGV